MQELWAFYSRFLEEQANDKIKVVRSRGDNTLAAKLEAMEWMSRYLTFVPSSSVQAINREFKKESRADFPPFLVWYQPSQA